MLKKILLALFLFITFFIGSSFAAELWKSYDEVDTNRQEKIKQKMDANPALYQQVADTMKGSTKNWQVITADTVKQMVNDGWLIWPITKCAESVSWGGGSCDDWNWNTLTVVPAASTTWWNWKWDSGQTGEIKVDKCRFDLEGNEAPSEKNGWKGDIRHALENCVWDSSLVQVADAWVTTWLKNVLNKWIQRIAWFLALGAMFAIAYGSLRLTLSGWEDENIKKAKDIIKWWILGFLAVISAGLLIATLVNLIYSLAG